MFASKIAQNLSFLLTFAPYKIMLLKPENFLPQANDYMLLKPESFSCFAQLFNTSFLKQSFTSNSTSHILF
jgi:hypothetical protein